MTYVALAPSCLSQIYKGFPDGLARFKCGEECLVDESLAYGISRETIALERRKRRYHRVRASRAQNRAERLPIGNALATEEQDHGDSHRRGYLLRRQHRARAR